ncbi:MAG: hypothetical protein A2Z16_11260 [Chloroflexi bacterium RBG_16_54_18]|nr:MAG: hypothetical protein A2Z16_11260 [Chloroflexi bacterium RBG_16_54_18]
MNWPIFLLGIVVGWIIEWLVDLLFWRKRQKKWMADESGYLTQLSEVQAELENKRSLVAQFTEGQTGLDDTRLNMEILSAGSIFIMRPMQGQLSTARSCDR